MQSPIGFHYAKATSSAVLALLLDENMNYGPLCIVDDLIWQAKKIIAKMTVETLAKFYQQNYGIMMGYY